MVAWAGREDSPARGTAHAQFGAHAPCTLSRWLGASCRGDAPQREREQGGEGRRRRRRGEAGPGAQGRGQRGEGETHPVREAGPGPGGAGEAQGRGALQRGRLAVQRGQSQTGGGPRLDDQRFHGGAFPGSSVCLGSQQCGQASVHRPSRQNEVWIPHNHG